MDYNIILLTIDSLRYDRIGRSGSHPNTTPFLDGLSEDSIRFEHAYSASTTTRESVPSFISGRYPAEAVDSNYNINTEPVTTHLTSYQSAAFHSNPYISRGYSYGEGFDKYDDDMNFGNNKYLALLQRAWDKLRNHHYSRAEAINQRALNWVNSLSTNRPFFLWNHYMDVHGPFEPPKNFKMEYVGEDISDRKCQQLYRRAIKNPGEITEEEDLLLSKLYDAEIAYIDTQIESFIQDLNNYTGDDRNIVIITSDHGELLGEYGHYGHELKRLHDELCHVPLIISHPKMGSRAVSAYVSLIDIVPTIAEITGNDIALPGHSLLELAKNEREYSDRAVFSQVRGVGSESEFIHYRGRDKTGHCNVRMNMSNSELVITDEDCTNKLRGKTKHHAKENTKLVNNESVDHTQHERADIEDRLDALGYK